MTCHAARRIGQFERQLRRARQEAHDALIMTDGELAGCERHQPGDFVDDAATHSACRVLANLEERDRRVLAEIDAAEARMTAGMFGDCEICTRPIPFARLRALPTARLCVSCEAAIERT